MSKPNIVLHDTRDDRFEVQRLLTHMKPVEIFQFVRWACELTWLVSRTMQTTSSYVTPGHVYTALIEGCRNGCEEAKKRLLNEVMMDLATLSHQYGVDYLVFLVELQNRAKGREATPIQVATTAYQMRHGAGLACAKK